MTVSFSLPKLLEEKLRAELGDLDAAGKEAALVELYRQGTLSQGELAEGLCVSQDEANGILKRHRAVEDRSGLEELDAQIARLRGDLEASA